ncbi:type II toxin-antitoxin system RelE family toxin [Kovacikia minuta]|uniref:type II toxin-antitoxin system RelE family toxin n=1 Tax=Kovacikia minuta TaxID=2931930 RepID=UPI0020C77136|nr:hypothetical protein [Kovacikia minuta]
MAYLVEFKAEALSGLERLSQKNQARVLRKIRWLADNFEQLTPQALTGDLSGLFKLRLAIIERSIHSMMKLRCSRFIALDIAVKFICELTEMIVSTAALYIVCAKT